MQPTTTESTAGRKQRSDKDKQRKPAKVELTIPSEYYKFTVIPRVVVDAYKHSRDWFTWTVLTFSAEYNAYFVSRYNGSARGANAESDVVRFSVHKMTTEAQKETRRKATEHYDAICTAEG